MAHSERIFQPQLNLPRIVRANQCSESRLVHPVFRHPELRVIERIEELGAEFEALGLAEPSMFG